MNCNHYQGNQIDVVLSGAGISIDSKLPSGSDLAFATWQNRIVCLFNDADDNLKTELAEITKNVKKEIDSSNTDDNVFGIRLEQIMELFLPALDRNWLISIYSETFKNAKINPNHSILARFDGLHLTANIDLLLENAGANQVMHLHGSCAEPDGICTTFSSYENNTTPLLKELSGKHLLVVGYSGRDNDILIRVSSSNLSEITWLQYSNEDLFYSDLNDDYCINKIEAGAKRFINNCIKLNPNLKVSVYFGKVKDFFNYYNKTYKTTYFTNNNLLKAPPKCEDINIKNYSPNYKKMIKCAQEICSLSNSYRFERSLELVDAFIKYFKNEEPFVKIKSRILRYQNHNSSINGNREALRYLYTKTKHNKNLFKALLNNANEIFATQQRLGYYPFINILQSNYYIFKTRIDKNFLKRIPVNYTKKIYLIIQRCAIYYSSIGLDYKAISYFKMCHKISNMPPPYRNNLKLSFDMIALNDTFWAEALLCIGKRDEANKRIMNAFRHLPAMTTVNRIYPYFVRAHLQLATTINQSKKDYNLVLTDINNALLQKTTFYMKAPVLLNKVELFLVSNKMQEAKKILNKLHAARNDIYPSTVIRLDCIYAEYCKLTSDYETAIKTCKRILKESQKIFGSKLQYILIAKLVLIESEYNQYNNNSFKWYNRVILSTKLKLLKFRAKKIKRNNIIKRIDKDLKIISNSKKIIINNFNLIH